MRLMGFAEVNTINDKETSHPPPAIRLALMFDNVIAILEKQGIVNTQVVLNKWPRQQ